MIAALARRGSAAVASRFAVQSVACHTCEIVPDALAERHDDADRYNGDERKQYCVLNHARASVARAQAAKDIHSGSMARELASGPLPPSNFWPRALRRQAGRHAVHDLTQNRARRAHVDADKTVAGHSEFVSMF